MHQNSNEKWQHKQNNNEYYIFLEDVLISLNGRD